MRALVLALPGVIALSACAPETPPSGHALFAEHCTACHGDDARGNGPLTAGLETAVPDLTTLSARHEGIFPRIYVMSTIDGYSRGQHEAQVMPEFGERDLGPMVVIEDGDGNGIPVPVTLLALADYIESLQGQ